MGKRLGSPRGGARPGAGRPKGIPNALPYGAAGAVKAAGLRVPESATPAERELADRALQRVVDVMEGKVSRLAVPVLGAARALREEICGPVKQRVEHSFSELTDEQLEAKYRAIRAKELDAQLSAGEPPEEQE